MIPCRVRFGCLQRTNRFHPSIKVAIIERRAVVGAFRQTGSDAEMFQVRLVLRPSHDLPHRRDCFVAASVQTLLPEIVRPFDFGQTNGSDRAIAAHLNRLRRRLLCDAASDSEEYQWCVDHGHGLSFFASWKLTPPKTSVSFDVADNALIANERWRAVVGYFENDVNLLARFVGHNKVGFVRRIASGDGDGIPR